MMMAMVEMRNQTVVLHQWHIGRGVRFRGEVRVILPIGIVCVTVWGIRIVFSWMDNGLTIDAWVGLCNIFSHCLHFMDPLSF